MKVTFNTKNVATALVAGILSGAVFSATAATASKTLPTEPYVVDGYTPDTRSAEAKETYANRVTKSDVEGNNHSVFGQDNTVLAEHGSTSVFGNQNTVGANAKDGNIYGDGSSIDGYQSQAVGDNNHLSGEQNTGIGMNNIVTGNHTHAIGGGNNITGDQSTAAGHYNLVKGHNSVAVGYDNKALMNETTVIGESSVANGLNASAFGSKTIATGESALAVGTGAHATNDTTVAVGNDSNATAKSSVALGGSTNATGVYSTAVGDTATANGNRSIAISVDSVAKADESIAIGHTSKSDGIRSIAVGANAQAKNESATVVGTFSKAEIRGTVIGAESEAYNHGFAGGYQAKATGESSTSIGVRANSTGLSTIAIGSDAVANNKASTAIGQGAVAEASYGVALGKAAKALHGSSVALGTAAETKQAVSVTEATVGKITYGGFAGTDATASVSVGKEGDHTRQIQNVGAGEISATSTDAINGSQLYATQDVINNVAGSVTTVLGGNAQVDNKGNITMTDIGGTGENTVHDAIKSHTDKIQANADNIAGNARNIATNTADIRAAEALIDKNAKDIATNTKAIEANAEGIKSNTNYIKAVEQKLPEVQAGDNTVVTSTTDANGKVTYTVSSKDFQPAIDANKAKIAENAKAIETNTADIRAAEALIDKNAKEIAGNTEYIKAVEQKLPEVKAGENTTVDVTVDANGKAVYTVSSKDFQPAIDAVDAKTATNAKAIEANKSAIAENTKGVKANAEGVKQNAEGVKSNTAKIAEVEKEAKRHTVVKAGQNVQVTKEFGENGEAVYTVGVETNHLATKAEVNKHIGAINDRIDGVEGKVAQNTKDIRKLDRDVRKNRKRADAGIASVAAMANIPQVYLPGKSGMGVGVGHKHGQSALAIGYSRTSDNAHHIIKLSAGVDSQKDVTVGAGYMYQW